MGVRGETMHILFAFDSFKGTFTSLEVARIVSEAFHDHLDFTEEQLAIADGGEGTLDTLVENRDGDYVRMTVTGPRGRGTDARYGIIGGDTAVIEMAEAAGLSLVPHDERNPLHASTEGVGELIRDALEKGIRTFIVGIGGSATTDMGMGLLHGLGYRFKDARGTLLKPSGAAMQLVEEIDGKDAHPGLLEAKFIVACDVKSPLYGEKGAAHVYGPQKGADMAAVKVLDKGLRHFSRAAARHTGREENLPRDGAAGGLGAGMRMFLGAELRNGFDVVREASSLDEALSRADIVLTGEGRIDAQTLMDKAPYGLARKAKEANKDVLAIAGVLDLSGPLRREAPFDAIMATMHAPWDGDDPNHEAARRRLMRLAGETARLLALKLK